MGNECSTVEVRGLIGQFTVDLFGGGIGHPISDHRSKIELISVERKTAPFKCCAQPDMGNDQSRLIHPKRFRA